MLPRRTLLAVSALSVLSAACEAIGLKATIVTTKTQNGQTTTRVREAKNWEEFEQAMGEVATDFSDFAKQVGATTVELAKKLVDVPPQGQVQLGQLAASLKAYEGDVRYDYLKVARMNPNAKYDFKYVQIGMPEYDNFFRASAEKARGGARRAGSRGQGSARSSGEKPSKRPRQARRWWPVLPLRS